MGTPQGVPMLLQRNLPSYHFTNALIEVMVRGRALPDVWPNLAAMAAWGLGAIFVASRTFKWE
jgi:hypothetical protein